MKSPRQYLKKRIINAIEITKGETLRKRIKKIAKLTLIDEDGNERRFSYKTISTWYVKYKKLSITDLKPN